MKSIIIALICSIFLIQFTGCTSRINDSGEGNGEVEKPIVERVGSDQTFEVATWNIENFPKSGTTTSSNLETMIADLDIDLICVQEITDQSRFNLMISNLPEWRSVLSDDEYYSGSYQKTGIIFRYSQISLSDKKNIFTDESYIFPRPPLAAYIQVRDGTGIKFDFNLIVMHLKAYGDEESIDRRRQACLKLEEYIRNQISAGADPDFVVLGDWNDQLELNQERDVFTPFLDRPQLYRFLTEPLTGSYTYLIDPYKNVIDHIMISVDAENEYGNGQTRILDLEKQYSRYISYISDHRPVVSIFKGFTLE